MLEATSLHCPLSTPEPGGNQDLRMNMGWSWPRKRPGFPTLDGSPKVKVSLDWS